MNCILYVMTEKSGGRPPGPPFGQAGKLTFNDYYKGRIQSHWGLVMVQHSQQSDLGLQLAGNPEAVGAD